MVFNPTQKQRDDYDLAISFGIQPNQDPYSFRDEWIRVSSLGALVSARLQAVGGNSSWTLQQLEQAEKPDAVPQMPSISVNNISDNSASVNWTLNPNDKPKVTSYHITLKNIDTDQTIFQFIIGDPRQPVSLQTNYFIQNLDLGTNYKVYLIAINAVGNSTENNIGFKTTGIKVEPEPEPIIISAQVQAILTKFVNNDYTYPSWFNKNIEWVKTGEIDSSSFLNSFNSMVQSGIIIDKTIPVEKEYNVNTYRINEFGVISNQIIQGINDVKLLELESKYFVTSVGTPTPSDQEIKDFYNYKDVDTSVKRTMVEARFLEFKIVNEHIEGKINFVTTKDFTDYWKDRIIYAHFQVKDSNGIVIPIGNEPKQAIKVNELKFLLDNIETISYKEYIGNIQAVTLEVYVWDITQKQLLNGRNIQAFSYPKTENIVIYDGDMCPTGYHLDFNGNCIPDGGKEKDIGTSLLGKVAGITALLGTLALLGSKRR